MLRAKVAPVAKAGRAEPARTADVVVDGEIEGADAARAGHPHRRVRLLDRPRPEVDVGEHLQNHINAASLCQLDDLFEITWGVMIKDMMSTLLHD